MSARAAHPAGNPGYLLVESLDDPRLRLSSALYVESHWEPEGVTVHHPESDVFGYGETAADALDDFRKAFVELFLTLSSDRARPRPGCRSAPMSETIYNLYEAKMFLSRLVDRAANGEEIILSKAGKPMAKLVPFRRTTEPRRPGGWEGRVRISEDFDAPLPAETQDAFEGRE